LCEEVEHVDKARVDRWLQAYVGAWKSYDPDQIGELFSEDVRYRYHPHDDPVAGRAELVRSWLGEKAYAGKRRSSNSSLLSTTGEASHTPA
jgi:hypothetical protein